MSDSYIYQRDIPVLGRSAASQIRKLVLPMDAGFKQALRAMAARLDAATAAVGEATLKAAAAPPLTAAPRRSRQGQSDPVATGRDLMRRLVACAASRPSGAALARDLLQGQTLATVLRRRPAKLIEGMTHALEALERHKHRLLEHAAWMTELERSRDALEPLIRSVRKSRLARRAMTPEMKAARAEWLTTYHAAKLLVECVLRLHGKASLMPQIFDDLADEHHVSTPVDPEPTSQTSAPASA
ncbi:hypothetical protein SOCE26_028800 [Sorangium cellulosum]|uniref:Uncharacterized protein n=1 Tax=Sorangium cellulosum TaxID=56 RepID=A0A2L0EQ84_SORCE|nr:hypothetical protein [Sorangium cellulosum]AUX41467.1 hypothetical protein SOCE26_028800 [Sorangium cellulosum]